MSSSLSESSNPFFLVYKGLGLGFGGSYFFFLKLKSTDWSSESSINRLFLGFVGYFFYGIGFFLNNISSLKVYLFMISLSILAEAVGFLGYFFDFDGPKNESTSSYYCYYYWTLFIAGFILMPP